MENKNDTKNVKSESFKELEELAYDNDFEFRPSYSGRCMFGRICPGIVGDRGDITFALGKAGLDFSRRYDSMGRSDIVYFPDVQGYEGDYEEDCDDE